MQYLQIGFEKPEPIYGVIIQGSPIFDQYVTSFKILHSFDGEAFHYLIDETKSPQIFSGPIDSRTPVKSLFKIPIEAKVIRIYPLTWYGSIAIRAELLGCSVHAVSENEKAIPPHHAEMNEKPMCDDQMGVENGILNDDQISLSSFKSDQSKDAAKRLLKLSSFNGWKPNIDSPNEYVVFDFLESRNITGIKTKGGSTCWITAYTVLYSQDLILWSQILSSDGKDEQVFLANFDKTTPKTNNFRFPIQARAIKITPKKWHDCIEVKIEPIGCFIPYKYRKNIVENPIEKMVGNLTACNICPGIENSPHLIEGVCACETAQFWNGNMCIERSLCPCVVDHLKYGVGAQFEKSDCSHCMCILGGVIQCKPKECRPCGPGLRRAQLASCLCTCEPCPVNEVLCQTSGACIPEKSWCDGIQDCPDDEINCAYNSNIHKKTIKKKKITEEVVITEICPEPKCPPRFYVKIVSNKKQAASAMFTSAESSSDDDVLDGIFKSPNDKEEERFKTKLPLPNQTIKEKIRSSKCVEYDCIPEKPIAISKTEKIVCPEPKCPDGYTTVTANQNKLVSACAKYKCELFPKKDVVCNVTGRTFNTFDDTEYKYDVCDHILARDLLTNKWIISLQVNCSAGNFVCHRQVVIVDKSCDLVVILHDDLNITLDGYVFSIDQLQKSIYSQMNLFTVSKVGDSILFVSHTQEFWIRLDHDGDVKVGVSSRYRSNVDGLCGFFNEYQDDDKRLPNGTTVMSTTDFGDSWIRDIDAKHKCEPHSCSQQIQDLAWELCSQIKDETFSSCSQSVSADHFISKCLESACECLRSGSQSKCKCSILQNYVTECMAIDENLHFDTWRSKFECVIKCPNNLVHRDCYRRRCEPSCDTLSEKDCPYLPGTCFPGCYCPEGTVRKGDKCVTVNDCKDCICDGFGRPQFITFDRKNFTFDRNCTYLLSRDIIIPNIHTFQVYASFGQCIDTNLKGNSNHICTKALHILYEEHIVHLQRNTSKGGYIKTLVDGIEVLQMPYKKEWISINDEGKQMIKIDLIKTLVEVNAIFDDLSFSIKIPSFKYSNKVEGFCGNCNGNPNDDLKPNPKHDGKMSPTNTNEILQTWLADESVINSTEKCVSSSEDIADCIPLPPEKDPCLQLLNPQTFGKCHLIVDALKYVSMCQIEICKIGLQHGGACSYLAAYARECSRNGICTEWQKDACSENFECPDDMEYKACSCHKTCGTINDKILDKCIESVEGCFCRDGKMLNSNGKCVPAEQCSPCDDGEHFVGDKWFSDRCTECECDDRGKLLCTKKQCAENGIVCQLGFKQVKVVSNDIECCPKFKCVPEIVSGICEEKSAPKCAEDQYVKMIVNDNNCTSYVCDCRPISECPTLVEMRPIQTGERIINDTNGCCTRQKIICDQSQCPSKPTKCEQEHYQIIQKPRNENSCCDEFVCLPPKHLCIINDKGKNINKKLGEIWPTEDPCLKRKCVHSEDASISIIVNETETCTITGCPNGYKLEIPRGKCCGECKQEKCIIDDKVFEVGTTWHSNDNCTTFRCSILGKQLAVSSSILTCPDLSDCPKEQHYFQDCCVRCKVKAEDKSKAFIE